MFEPVRSLGPLVVNRNLVGWRHVGINTANASPMLHIVAIIAGAVTAGNNEIIPEQTACFRHLHIQRIVTNFCLLRVFGGQRQKFFSLLVLPKPQQYLINLLLRLNLQSQSHLAPCFSSPSWTAIIHIMGVMFNFIACKQPNPSFFAVKGGKYLPPRVT